MEGYTTETEQLQALKKWWDQNAKWIIAGLVIAALVVGGWRLWGYWKNERSSEAAGLYAAVIQAEGQGSNAAVEAAAKKLVRAFPDTAYGALGGLALAKSQFAQQHMSDAESSLRAVIAHSPDEGLALIARVRLARVQLQRGSPKDALTTLKGQGKGSFAATMQSLRGDALLQLGDTEAARTAYEQGLAESDAQSGLHQLLALRLASLPTDHPMSVAPASATAAASDVQTAQAATGGKS
ncbi:MAG: tetratricopeptide repeat protein [Gammaproteobacteria bacterium]